MIKVKFIILFLAISAGFGSTTLSQENFPATNSLESLRKSIDRLEKLTEQSKKTATAESTSLATIPNSVTSDLSKLLGSLSDNASTAGDSERQNTDTDSEGVNDILYKLELLQKLKSENKSPLESIAPESANPLRNSTMDSDAMAAMSSTAPPTRERSVADPAMPTPPLPIANEPLPARKVETPFSNAQSVIADPINPFEMGNSLFLTGKFRTALDAYETVDMENMRVFDAAWLRYMKATCHRQLGNGNDADRIYREISKEKNVRVLVDSAKWWLKHSDRTQAFEAQIQQLQSNLELMAERSKRIENQ